MATTIQIKRSSTASGVPLATDLAVGELAVNLADKRLFTKQSDGTIIELSTNPTDLDAATLRIDGVEITASATELNKLDGFTGSTTELNILDGVTATTAEINKLDGFTGSTAELNFVDGVTSNIQTQLNSKASSTTSPTITLGGDLSGSATLTNLGSATITATVADDSHNHVISNVDGLQTALDGKATSAQGALADSAVQPNDNVSLGTVTADGLEVDGSTVINGGASGTDTDVFSIKNDAGTAFLRVRASDLSSSACDWTLRSGASESIIFSPASSKAMELSSNGDVSFYENTGTTAKMVWDASAESLGIGTASPNESLHVYDASANVVANFESGDANAFISFKDSSTTNTDTVFLGATGDNMAFYAGSAASERMRIDSAGNVGIGGTPNEKLSINTGSNNGGLRLDSASGNYPFITFTENGAASCYLGDAGGFGGTASNAGIRAPLGAIEFRTGASERARIDSSGNLLVGKTSLNGNTTGFQVEPAGAIAVTRSGSTTAYFNRLSSDGEIVAFRKDGSTVGSIGSNGGRPYLASATVGIRVSNALFPSDTSGAITDGAMNIGGATGRFKDLYLSGGVYLGGTGAANKLDDYEEGVWTPVYSTTGTGFTSITMDASSATYTKVGNLVNVKALIRTDELTLGSASGAVIIRGLPFVATSGFGSTATFVYRSGFVNAPMGGYVQSGGTYIVLRKSTGITANSAGVPPSDLTEGTLENKNYVMMDMTYQA